MVAEERNRSLKNKFLAREQAQLAEIEQKATQLSISKERQPSTDEIRRVMELIDSRGLRFSSLDVVVSDEEWSFLTRRYITDINETEEMKGNRMMFEERIVGQKREHEEFIEKLGRRSRQLTEEIENTERVRFKQENEELLRYFRTC